jgi:hypothetical protein
MWNYFYQFLTMYEVVLQQVFLIGKDVMRMYKRGKQCERFKKILNDNYKDNVSGNDKSASSIAATINDFYIYIYIYSSYTGR